MKKQYRLFYQDVEIGNITHEDGDFPKNFGTFHPVAGNNQSPVSEKIRQYIAYSVAADRIMQEGREAEWERFVIENESPFLDLIETDAWRLLDEEGIELILIPSFCVDDGIVWRWNVYPGSHQ